MKKIYKKKEEKLTSEGTELRQPVAELEAPTTYCKQTEEALQESEELFQTIVSKAPVVIWSLDKNGIFTLSNGAGLKPLGLRPGEVVGQSVFDVYRDVPQICEDNRRALAGETLTSIVEVGDLVYESHYSPLQDKNGEVIGMVGVSTDITERKRMEEALKESRDYLKRLTDSMWDAVFSVKMPERVIEWANDSFRLIGYEPAECIGKTTEFLYPDKDGFLEFGNKLKKAMSAGKDIMHTEQLLKRKNGEVFPAEITATIIRNEEGEVVGITSIVRDITERKKAEERLQTILKTAIDGFWLTNLEGKLLEVNDSYCKMIGYTREELLKMSISDLEAAENPEEVAQHIAKITEQGYHSFESRHRRKDGKIINVEISVNYLDVGEGQLFVFARDITDRKRAEEALELRNAHLQQLFDNSPEAIVLLDNEDRIVNANRGFETLYGYTLEELKGHAVVEVIVPEDLIEESVDLKKATQNGEIRRKETVRKRKDGSLVDVYLLSYPIRSGNKAVGSYAIYRDITGRKQAEEALQAEKNKLQSVIGAMEYDLTIQDKDFNVIYQNEASRMNSGGDHVGEKCYRVYEGRDKICVGCPLEKAFKDGKSHTAERKVITPSGEAVYWENTANPIRDAKGEIVSCLEVGRNITERKQAEEALRDSEEKTRKMFKSVTDGISVVDLNGIITEVNQRTVEMHGFASEDEMIGKSALMLAAPHNREKIAKNMRQALKRGTVRDQEYTLVRSDGSEFLAELSTSVLKDASGKAIGHITVARDITDRKQVEEALRDSEEFNSSLLTNSPNPMLVINQDTSIKYANPALEKLTGFSATEVLGRKAPYPWWTKEMLHKTGNDLEQAMHQGATRLEELFQKKNGERFWVEITSVPVTSNGEFKYYLANWVDVTERKQAEERERELQRELYLSSRLAAIGELAAGVAHQINNPLTGVLGFSQRLLRKSTDQETNQDLKRIYTEAERAAKVVQNLLTFARRRQPQKQYSDINEILESALELRAYELTTSNIEVVTDLAPNLPELMLDFQQIEEVFLNIILNAEQALTETNGGGKLIIKTEERKEYIRTTFSDNGPGIPAEHLDKIFDPFFTTKGEKGGTGLGLSVCHGIISEHGGKIYAKSKPGKGATFFVELPLAHN